VSKEDLIIGPAFLATIDPQVILTYLCSGYMREILRRDIATTVWQTGSWIITWLTKSLAYVRLCHMIYTFDKYSIAPAMLVILVYSCLTADSESIEF
jgi:hypothetical protein